MKNISGEKKRTVSNSSSFSELPQIIYCVTVQQGKELPFHNSHFSQVQTTEQGRDSKAFTCRQNHNSLGKMETSPDPIINVLVYKKAIFSYIRQGALLSSVSQLCQPKGRAQEWRKETGERALNPQCPPQSSHQRHLSSPLSVFPYTLRASSSKPCWAQISLIKSKQKPEIGKPLDRFPPQIELPFHLHHSRSTPSQTMHNCPSTVVTTTPYSLRAHRRSP